MAAPNVRILSSLISALGLTQNQAEVKRTWEIPVGAELLYEKARRDCPYMRDRAQRNLSCEQSLGPDIFEQNAHSTSFLAEQLQSKRQAGRNPPVMTIPRGLPPEIHFEQGLKVESPLDVEPPVPDDLDFALRTIVKESKNIDAWRAQQFSKLNAFVEECTPLATSWDEQRSDNSVKVASHVSLVGIDLSAYSLSWPDESIRRMFQIGANPVGQSERTGLFRTKSVQASKSMAAVLAESVSYLDGLERRPAPKREQMQAISKKSAEELRLGFHGSANDSPHLFRAIGFTSKYSATGDFR